MYSRNERETEGDALMPKYTIILTEEQERLWSAALQQPISPTAMRQLLFDMKKSAVLTKTRKKREKPNANTKSDS